MDFADLGELLRPLLEAGQQYGDALVPLGLTLLSLSLVLTLMWGTYLWWLGEHEGALAKAGKGLILFLIPLGVLQGGNWTAAAGGLAEFFQQEVTAPLLERGGQQATGGGTSLVKNLITKISNSIWADAEINVTSKSKSAWDKSKEFFQNPANTVGSVLFGSMTDFLLRLLLTAVGMILIMSMLFALYGPLLMLQIGIILGPILICWLPFRPMADLPRQWFKFMLTSGMSLVVGVVLVLICAGSIDTFISSIAVVQSSDLPWFMQIVAKFGAFVAAASAMLFMAHLMFKADNIASALIGGATEGSGVGAVVMKTVEKAGNTGGGGGSPKPEPPKK